MREKPMISAKQAECLIYDMTKFSDHSRKELRNISNDEIKYFFESNGEKWKFLIEKTRYLKAIPFVENILGYEWHSPYPNVEISMQEKGVITKKLSEPGQFNILPYHSSYKKALEEREQSIKMNDGAALLSCITHGIIAIENYITRKALIYNKRSDVPIFDEKESRLDTKLNDWFHRMVGYKMNQSPASIWIDFCFLKKINNDFKHEGLDTQAFSYSEMIKTINKFRTGIAKILFILNQKFKDPIPSRVVRGIYLPDVF